MSDLQQDDPTQDTPAVTANNNHCFSLIEVKEQWGWDGSPEPPAPHLVNYSRWYRSCCGVRLTVSSADIFSTRTNFSRSFSFVVGTLSFGV